MLVTVSVLAVTLGVAVPGLGGFLRSSQLNGTQTELASSLVLARSEATKRGVQTAVGATAPSSGTEFSGGWTVWVDSNANGVIDAGEAVIRQYPPRKNQVAIGTLGGETVVSFQPSGFVVGTSSVTFRVCDGGGSHRGYLVSLDPVGLADAKETSCP
jgi:type IV fimbrial biogenesis protein FimT